MICKRVTFDKINVTYFYINNKLVDEEEKALEWNIYLSNKLWFKRRIENSDCLNKPKQTKEREQRLNF
jgi:hypothetical protein